MEMYTTSVQKQVDPANIIYLTSAVTPEQNKEKL
jgi:hypothetical protein